MPIGSEEQSKATNNGNKLTPLQRANTNILQKTEEETPAKRRQQRLMREHPPSSRTAIGGTNAYCATTTDGEGRQNKTLLAKGTRRAHKTQIESQKPGKGQHTGQNARIARIALPKNDEGTGPKGSEGQAPQRKLLSAGAREDALSAVDEAVLSAESLRESVNCVVSLHMS